MNYALLIRGILAALELGTRIAENAGRSPEELEIYIKTRNELREELMKLSNEDKRKAGFISDEPEDDSVLLSRGFGHISGPEGTGIEVSRRNTENSEFVLRREAGDISGPVDPSVSQPPVDPSVSVPGVVSGVDGAPKTDGITRLDEID